MNTNLRMLLKRRVSLKSLFFILIGITFYLHYVTYKSDKTSIKHNKEESNNVERNYEDDINNDLAEKHGLNNDIVGEEDKIKPAVHQKEMEELDEKRMKMIEERTKSTNQFDNDKNDENNLDIELLKNQVKVGKGDVVLNEKETSRLKAAGNKETTPGQSQTFPSKRIKEIMKTDEKSIQIRNAATRKKVTPSAPETVETKANLGEAQTKLSKTSDKITKNTVSGEKITTTKFARIRNKMAIATSENTDSTTTFKHSPTTQSKAQDAIMQINASDEKGKTIKNVETTTNMPKSTKKPLKGKVNVYSWKDICINIDNYNVYWNPLFPKIPHKAYLLDGLQDGDWIRTTASRRFIGYLHVPESGYYSFQMLSRDGMDVMLFDGNFRNSSVLLHFSMDRHDLIEQSKIIENDRERMFDLYTKVSKEINLNSGHNYLFDIIHSCSFFGRMELKIKKRGEEIFKIIGSSYISAYHDSDDVNAEMPNALFFNKHSKLHDKFKLDRRFYYGDKISLNSKTCNTGLETCEYEPSYLFKGKELKLYYGTGHVQRDLIYPDDNTRFPGKDLFKRILEKSKAEAIANQVFQAIAKSNNGKYKLKYIVNVEENNEKRAGKRYFVELDMEGIKDGKMYRFSDYFLKPSLNQPLCLPENYSNWQNDVTIYMVCAIKNQRPWVRYLIKSIENLIKRTNDSHLHLILVDFNSTDMNVEKLIQASKLNYTYIQMKGNFSKAKALNEGVRRIPDNDSIVFVMDLQLQIPDHIFNQARKHTIQGKMTYCPILMRLQCGEHPEFTNISSSIWMDIGFGMMSLYKSDWLRIGGMNEEKFSYQWGGEDWEFVDRVMLGQLELVHIRLPHFYHIYHSTLGTWDGTKLI